MEHTILIFGSDGQLGQALLDVYPLAVPINQSACDITEKQSVIDCFKLYKPTVVINVAAYADTEKAETSDTINAYNVNVVGVKNIAVAARLYNTILVQISTDYIFDGSKDLFTEDDIPHPLNVHGLTKLSSEYTVQAYCNAYYIIRTSALFGPTKSSEATNFVAKRLQQIRADCSITMVNDQWTVPTYTPDLAIAIKKIITKKIPFGVYHCVNSGGGVTWFDWTQEIAHITDSDISIKSMSTIDVKSDMQRPKKSILDNTKLEAFGIGMPNWRDSLRDYLKKEVF